MTSLTVPSPAPSIGIRIAGVLVSVLALILGIALLAMFVFVVPKFEAAFADFGTQLPTVAIITITASEIVLNMWYLFLGLFGGLVGVLVVVSLAARSRGPIIGVGFAAGGFCLLFSTMMVVMMLVLSVPLLSLMESLKAKP